MVNARRVAVTSCENHPALEPSVDGVREVAWPTPVVDDEDPFYLSLIAEVDAYRRGWRPGMR